MVKIMELSPAEAGAFARTTLSSTFEQSIAALLASLAALPQTSETCSRPVDECTAW